MTPEERTVDKPPRPPTGMLPAALDLARRGFPVFPVHSMRSGACDCSNGATCDRPAKHPHLAGGYKGASTDSNVIQRWWGASFRTANIGIACGGELRLVVIDVDGPDGGAALEALSAERGALPVTLTVRTGRGAHYYFRCPEDFGPVPPNGASKIGPKIDHRGEGGYVVAPPSVHASGAVYAFEDAAAELAPLPRWLYDLATREKAREAPAAPPSREATVRQAPGRPDAFVRAVAWLESCDPSIQGEHGSGKLAYAACGATKGFLLSDGDALGALREWNQRCSPPWSERELDHAIDYQRTNGRAFAPGELLRAERRSPGPAAPPRDDDAAERAAIEDDAPENAGRSPGPESEAPRDPFAWVGVSEAFFSELPPIRWIVKGLQICAGRPSMIAGYGSSGKTLAAQSLALAVATGRRAWEQLHTGKPLRVRHVDHEQGRGATLRRYRRLALGHGIEPAELADAEAEGRFGVSILPSIYLSDPATESVYRRAFEGIDLVIVDALKGATPGVDENESRIREHLDKLTRISEDTGAAFAFLHHAGKPKEGHSDARTVPRGSSAIFDACGSVFVLAGEKGEPKLMRHEKSAAEAEGGNVEDFYLKIEDIAAADGNPTAGVRVVYQTKEQVRPPRSPEAEFRGLCKLILAKVAQMPGVPGKGALATLIRKRPQDVGGAVEVLLADGRLVNRPQGRAPRFYLGAGRGEEATEGDE